MARGRYPEPQRVFQALRSKRRKRHIQSMPLQCSEQGGVATLAFEFASGRLVVDRLKRRRGHLAVAERDDHEQAHKNE